MPETEPTAPADIDALAVLLEAATPGPWEAGETEHYSESAHGGMIHFAYCAVEPSVASGAEPADAALIAAAVNALPSLLAEVNASREALARVEPQVAHLERRPDWAEVLAGHWNYNLGPDCDRWLCECGEVLDFRTGADLDGAQQAHLASVLDATLDAWSQS